MGKLTRRRIPNRFGGSDYRIGRFVAIKEDEREHGDPAQHNGAEISSLVTWGAVPVDLYDERDGDVGLPDAAFEAATLRELVTWASEQP